MQEMECPEDSLKNEMPSKWDVDSKYLNVNLHLDKGENI